MCQDVVVYNLIFYSENMHKAKRKGLLWMHMGSVTPLENDKFVIPVLLVHIAISVTSSTYVIVLYLKAKADCVNIFY